MKLEEIKKRVQEVDEYKGDDESAHILEDRLFYEFVDSIKNGEYETIEDVIIASQELMKVRKIEFARWHA